MQIDIAHLLTYKSGELLAQAQTAYKEKNRELEIESCIQTVLLFQAAMEAIINEEIHNHSLLKLVRAEDEDLQKRYKSLSFRNKWKKAYEVLQIKELEYLNGYLRFYSTYRTPITHPKSRYQSINKYTFQNICKGIENGWYAFQLLYAILGKELTSWEEFCARVGITTS